MTSNKLDRRMLADLRESLTGYDAMMAELKARRAEIQRTERRIGLIAALVSVEGASVELPNCLEPEIAERLNARIKAIADACLKRI